MANQPTDRRLNRLPSTNEERLTAYPVRAAMPRRITPVAKYWRLGPVTDQGHEGACVGHGWTSDAMASPARVHIGPYWANQTFTESPDTWANSVYRAAQKVDEWPGEDYEGTSVDAGAKIMRQRGLIGTYRWVRTISDVRDAIITTGPVVIGIWWYESMYGTESSGRVRIQGEVVGGHCLLVYGYNPRYYVGGKYQEIFRWRNSWGPGYGKNGNAFITGEDFRRLMEDEDGEGCVPMQRYAVPTLG